MLPRETFQTACFVHRVPEGNALNLRVLGVSRHSTRFDSFISSPPCARALSLTLLAPSDATFSQQSRDEDQGHFTLAGGETPLPMGEGRRSAIPCLGSA